MTQTANLTMDHMTSAQSQKEVTYNTNLDEIDGRLSSKVKFTPEGGLAIQLINETGAASIKGTLVDADSAVDEAFNVAEIDDYDGLGFVYEDGIADGSACWVVIAGIAEALVEDSTAVSRADLMLCGSTTAGRIEPSSTIPPPTNAEHFRETGHAITSCTAGTGNTIKLILHWN